MSEHDAGNGAATQRRTARVLRERLGGVPNDVVAGNQARIQSRRRIVEALGQGPRTIPEIALATRLASHEVLWHVMAMKKYGKVVEGPQRGDYYEYALIETEGRDK